MDGTDKDTERKDGLDTHGKGPSGKVKPSPVPEHLGRETAAKKVCAEGAALSAGLRRFFQKKFGDDRAKARNRRQSNRSEEKRWRQFLRCDCCALNSLALALWGAPKDSPGPPTGGTIKACLRHPLPLCWIRRSYRTCSARFEIPLSGCS